MSDLTRKRVQEIFDLAYSGNGVTTTMWELAEWALERDAAATKAEEKLARIKERSNCHCLEKVRAPQPGPHHRMSCRNYVGPLMHEMRLTGINGTFGGFDYNCVCGGWFRQGGIAGHGDGTETAKVVCPNADQDWRGPRA